MGQNVRVALVITAAGLSKRFGGDKLAYSINGIPMGIACLRQYAAFPFCQRIVVTDSTRSYLIEEAEKLGYTLCLNSHPEAGLSSSVMLGTGCLAPQEIEGIAYADADQPYLTDASILALLNAFSRQMDCIWGLQAEGRRGKPTVFPVAYYSELLNLQGDRGGKSVIERHTDKLRTVQVNSIELKDIDTKEGI